MADILKREQGSKYKNSDYQVDVLTRASLASYSKLLKEHLDEAGTDLPKKILRALYHTKEEELAFLVLRVCIGMAVASDSASRGFIPLNHLARAIGKSIINSKTLKTLEEEEGALNAYIDRQYFKAKESQRLKAKIRSATNVIKEAKDLELIDEGNNAVAVGIRLVSVLIEAIDMFELVRLDSKRRTPEGLILSDFKPDTYLIRFTYEARLALIDLDYKVAELLKPTVKPLRKLPTPVSKVIDPNADLIEDGRPQSLVKMPRRKGHPKEFKAVIENMDISKFIGVHRAIEETGWVINTRVLDVVKYIFEENVLDTKVKMFGGTSYEFHPQLLAGLPRRHSLEIDDVLKKENLGRVFLTHNQKLLFESSEKQAINLYNRIKNDMIAFNEVNLNKALTLKSQLSLAEEFKDDVFYFTYQYDNRGRIYPVQGTLSPQGDSVSKALLLFSKGEPLTETGFRYAKIHGANCYGLDKKTIKEKIDWVDSNEDLIHRIADNPILNTSDWVEVDDPFGFLAFCFEYSKALRDPKYPYRLHVALDGTCSGIQIYSGLLRDKKGAEAVNVIGDVRHDIYEEVAKVANRMLAEGNYTRIKVHTNASGEEETFDYKPIADSLKGKITRELTKRNTMTQPYSVTLVGMQNQIKEILDELESKGKKFWVGENWQVSNLISQVNLQAIDEVVQGARRGQEFIKTICKYASDKNKGLLWTTPMGFKVYQKNVKARKVQFDTVIWTPDRGNQRVQLKMFKRIGKVNGASQANSSAPNVVHSFDTTLLHFSVARCLKQGVNSFAMIHDSYGVHPNYGKVLDWAIRESYVEIFSKDCLINWAVEVLLNAGYDYEGIGKIFLEIDNPMIDTLDLNEVLKSEYIFS